MDFLSRLDDAYVWAKSRGVYQQMPLYHRGSVLFAKWGSGYIRLSISGATSAPNVTWLEIDPGQNQGIDARDGHMPSYNPPTASQTAARKKRTKIAAVA